MKRLIIGLGVVIILGGFLGLTKPYKKPSEKPIEIAEMTPTPPLPTPTLKPISWEELNQKFGPCVRVNVIIYHHIQDEEVAEKNGQKNLSVSPEYFRKHLEYLINSGYKFISPIELVDFFDNGISLGGKLSMITLDDAYEDNYTNAWPILKELGIKAVIFTPTGLVENPGYLSWNQMKEMSGEVYFANHTWSHQASKATEAVLEREISIAETQLQEHGQDEERIFAYPYGNPSKTVEQILTTTGFKLAFTTRTGNILCKGQRLILPRIRVGNAPLSKFGL